MKAAVRVKYGPPKEVLSIKEIDKPSPKDDEVLIRVYAASANRTDYHVLTGTPFFMRFYTGLFKPGLTITGSDFAGQVEAIGSAVTSFKVGDKVMGFGGVFCIGSHTEYITFPESKGIVLMPENITYEQAAACLEGTYYSAAGINHLKPTAGQKALVYGATGAIGSADVQFLKYYGVYVTAVCGGEHTGLVKSLGADKVIDYKTQDFTKDEEQYDYVFDAVDKTGFLQCKRLLKKKGIYTSSGGFEYMAWALITKITGGKKVLFIVPKDIKGNLGFIKRLIEEGRFRPVIDRTYPLDKIAEAFTYVGTHQKIGNVIIKMDV
ncbi:NAD(P)-dependent alcohol dehydrogenase [Terrimonas pollutisoli]|uniref:NAD(P)-dependent alcohol dehydrogenase n=1 Tax=Terrimonas pollutisoli TaxID=3034147 RepID=UPI0023EC2709|nr:NAD(P)-dependent alcohol dehydrogenase [Terrimonas sp. H1YJ31]